MMIPAKIEPTFITTKREKGMESIIDWFDLHKQSFYTLGRSYLRNQKQMGELFYRTIINVHKELPRLKQETSFETKATSIFIQTCRELSNEKSPQAIEENETHQQFFNVLDQLNKYEKEALTLTYIKGLSQEEVAHLLQVSVEKLKDHLFFGIQSLRKGMGYEQAFNGCNEYHRNYVDYLEKNLDRSKKIDFEVHMHQCQHCREDLASFQEVMVTLLNSTKRMFEEFHVPSDFMENVRARFAEKEKNRKLKNKKRKKIGIAIASLFALLIGIGIFTGSFTNLYYTWTEEDPELRPFLQKGLGERLNLEAENNGIKIKIKSAIADDIQTLVFYEIEDTKGDNQYLIDNGEGVSVDNEIEMNSEADLRFYPPDLKSDLNKKEKNVYHGKISLQPLLKDKGVIKLSITQLQKLVRDSSNRNSVWGYEGMEEAESGKWNFEIPLTKKPSFEYALNGETEIEGIPVRFDKLTVAPTTTVLDFAINNERTDKQVEGPNFDNIVVNDKKVKADLYNGYSAEYVGDWIIYQSNFNPLFGEKPKKVNVQFASARLTFKDEKTIELDASKKYPQTFEYAGSKISIDKVKVGKPTKVVISNSEIKNRAYETLDFEFFGDGKNEPSSMESETQGVLVDKNGKEYDMNLNPFAYEEIEQPRYFETVYNMTLQTDNPKEKVIPKRLVIHGYNTMKYIDDVVKISVKHKKE
ncbi:hypothetical protein B5V88_12710 [Heyndrickxia sporothermodurans]|nr:hypothetical protein B5V88_12710 [Heyndrickxia sporothermodurans]PTY83520.1 hypothetical protein B5V91_16495 [Heyndrickxia sporothermodurans]PTY89861.1 hypothetical protein B5V90_06905 [Heyndrickxia sporothermodurans]